MASAQKPEFPIPHRPLGASGLQVSCLGLGLAALGRPGYINQGHGADLKGRTDRPSMEANSLTVIEAAYQAGVTYFDAARSYGAAEAFLGTWLDQKSINSGSNPEVVIGSKWGYTYVADWKVDAPVHEVKDHSAETFSRQYEETQQLLGDHLNLYQIHSVTPDSPALTDAETLRRLTAYKERGLLLGFSTSGPQQADVIRQALAITTESGLLFDVVQSTWNVLEPSAGPALVEAHNAGLGVIIKEALANGRLTQRGDYGEALSRRPASDSTPTETGEGPGPDAIALASALAQPFVSVVLSGATNVEQLQSNLRALNAEPVEHIVPIEPERYWAERSQRSWT